MVLSIFVIKISAAVKCAVKLIGFETANENGLFYMQCRDNVHFVNMRPDVVIVKAGEMKYAEIIKRIKNGKEVQSLSNNISAVSETRSGHLRVVLSRETKDVE